MTETATQTRRLGYAGVSAYGQMFDGQFEQLRAEAYGKVFRESGTGATKARRGPSRSSPPRGQAAAAPRRAKGRLQAGW